MTFGIHFEGIEKRKKHKIWVEHHHQREVEEQNDNNKYEKKKKITSSNGFEEISNQRQAEVTSFMI